MMNRIFVAATIVALAFAAGISRADTFEVSATANIPFVAAFPAHTPSAVVFVVCDSNGNSVVTHRVCAYCSQRHDGQDGDWWAETCSVRLDGGH